LGIWLLLTLAHRPLVGRAPISRRRRAKAITRQVKKRAARPGDLKFLRSGGKLAPLERNGHSIAFAGRRVMLITVFTWRLDWMRQRFLRQLGLQLILLIGTLIAAELILRAIDLRELRYGYRDGYPVVFRYDPEIGWLPVANRIATFEGSKPITVRSNSFGLRDIEHDHSARPTVMFVGDSLVWGYDVEESERFTELLRDGYPGIRIVNAGVNAYGTDQEYLLLRRLWRAFNPDVVVFCVDNDHRTIQQTSTLDISSRILNRRLTAPGSSPASP
jgi:hypothetical protein